MIRAGIADNKIIIETDDFSVESYMTYNYKDRIFNPYKRAMTYSTVSGHIWNRMKTIKGVKYYELNLGWSAYLANILRPYISTSDYNQITSNIFQETYRDSPFPELRDYQNSDILHLLKYKIGLFSCYTGYGKSQCISVLANYFVSERRFNVLLVTPNIKSRDELCKRIKSLYGITVETDLLKPGSIKIIITSGLGNRKSLKTEKGLQEFKDKLGEFQVVLSDEVEYCINDQGDLIFSNCINATYFYGFSGTADKQMASLITFNDGLTKIVATNKNLIKYFGPSLIYRVPNNLDIDLIMIKTEILNHLNFDDLEDMETNSIYPTVMERIWTNPKVCELIVRIASTYKGLFIPINNLTSIISNWIDNYFIGRLRILLISGEGYIYYNLNGERKKLDLQQACDVIRAGEVDIIPSTSSGYRALDFPGLENIFLIQGAIAGVVLQCIGRVARGTHVNIIGLDPLYPTQIPLYTKGVGERKKMIKDYYKYCNIKEINIKEENL